MKIPKGKIRGKKLPDVEPASDLFKKIVVQMSSIHVTCEFCGREHFVNNPNEDWERAEYENLVAERERNPKIIIAHSDAVKWGRIDGREVVLECPCRGLRQYEDFIWEHRQLIMDYIRRRLMKMRVELEKEERYLIVSPFEDFTRERQVIEEQRDQPDEERPLSDDLHRSVRADLEREDLEHEGDAGDWSDLIADADEPSF